jgi:hypothetical protein
MPFKGKHIGPVLAFVAAAILCVVAGVAVGRLPIGSLLPKTAPAAQAVHSGSSQAVYSGLKGTRQGVTVHGWWTIKVVDQGRVVSERQFENALVNSGASEITSLLTGHKVGGFCNLFVYQNGLFLFDLVQLRTDLTVAASGGHIVLSGNHTATAAMSIDKVQTNVFTCPSTATASTCSSGAGGHTGHQFTDANLSPPVSVANGQIVQITVDISFS